jgi:hypothetical protein
MFSYSKMVRKMGRRPMDPKHPKTQQINFRLSEELLERLRAAAKAGDRNVTEEIRRRIERSFIGEEARAVETLGSHETYALFLLIGQAFRTLREQTGHWWHRDRFTFDHAVEAVTEIMGYFRPRGRRKAPTDMPQLDMMRARGLKTGDAVTQAKTFPFGQLAGRLAVFQTEAPPGDTMPPLHKIFQRISIELRPHLVGSPRADLLKGSNKQ